MSAPVQRRSWALPAGFGVLLLALYLIMHCSAQLFAVHNPVWLGLADIIGLLAGVFLLIGR